MNLENGQLLKTFKKQYFRGIEISSMKTVTDHIYSYAYYYAKWAQGEGYPPDLQQYIDEHGPIFS